MLRQHHRKTWHQLRDARTTRLRRRTGSFVGMTIMLRPDAPTAPESVTTVLAYVSLAML
jgi:hypothetical protein